MIIYIDDIILYRPFFILITKSIIKCTQLFFRIIKAVKSKKKMVLPPK